MHNFKELKVWKAGIDLSKTIYQLTRSFSTEERFGLISQMTRSAISIPSNIAEGCSRGSKKEFNQFLHISLGSAFELETQVIIASEFGFIEPNKLIETRTSITDIQKMISALQKTLVIS